MCPDNYNIYRLSLLFTAYNIMSNLVHNIRIVCLYDVDLLHKQTKKIMKKVEFVQEQRANDAWIFYYTTIDSMFVSESGSSDKETAYQKFIILANGGSLSPIKTILETKTID